MSSTGVGNVYCRRTAIAFSSINRPGTADFKPGMQKHHLLPLQLLSMPCFERMIGSIGAKRVGFDDFRANGMLLPADEATTLRTGMPLHRGPHRAYNAMAIDRVGQIESEWAGCQSNDPVLARRDALFRLGLLQSALRKRLLFERRRLVLNRNDPLGAGYDFSELDAMAEALWKAS